MKKIIATALSASLAGTMLLTATGAAMAQPYRGHYDRGYHGNAGAAIGLGLGLFALGAIIATNHDRYDDRYGYRYAPPPPAYRYRDGYYYGR